MSEKVEIIIQAKDQFSRTMKSLRGMLPSVKTLALGAGAAVAGLGTGLFAIANSTAKAGDAFQKMSLRLGLSTDLLSGMKHAVELSGAGMEALEKGVRTLAKRMSDADEGLTEAERSFTALGIQIKNADGSLKSLDTMMAEAAQGLAGMEDNTKRVALAQELFGRSGTALLPLFKQGAEGLRKMTDEAKALGITFDKAGADEAAAFRDNMLRLQRVFTGIKTQIGTALIPIFNEYAGALKEVGIELVKAIKDNRDKVKEFAESFLTTMMYLGQGVGSGVAIIIDSFNELQIIWEKLKIAFGKFSITIHEGLNDIRQAYIGFLEKLGLWDKIEEIFSIKPDTKTLEMFERLGIQADITTRSFKSMILGTQENVDSLKKLQEQSEKTLEDLKKHPSTLDMVTDAFAYFKAMIEKVRSVSCGGIPPFDDANTEKTKGNIAEITTAQQNAIQALHDMWAEYYLTEGERIDLWYAEQYGKYEGNENALYELDQIYRAKHKELAERTLKDREDAETATNDRIRNERMHHLQNLANIGLIFGKKGLAISRALAIPHAYIATRDAAISAYKAMAGIPIIGPALGVAAAIAATAYGMKQVGLIKAQTAHTGLTRVPREQAYVLAQRERVISGPQNEDLTRFLEGNREPINVDNFNVRLDVLPNAGRFDALFHMSKRDWLALLEGNFIPALRELHTQGQLGFLR